MRYGIFSDVHANLYAFREALIWYKRQRIDRYIFLGDIVGYGAHPKEAIALLQTLDAECVYGNHDWACVGKTSVSRFNQFARTALAWTQELLTDNERRVLSSFDLIYRGDDFVCVHGSLYEPEAFHYILDEKDARFNFMHMQHNLCFVGHSHRQEVFMSGRDGSVIHMQEATIAIEGGARYIINVGSVGQPRDRDSRGCVCIYDTQARTVTMHRFEYDTRAAHDAIIEHGLPSFLAERLYKGV